MNTSAVANRVVGQYPLSIATSLALEAMNGVHPDRPDSTRHDFDKHDVMWVNLKTIFRNLYQAVDRDDILAVNPRDLLTAYASEVDQFERLVSQFSEGKMQVIWYISNYVGMAQKYPNAILRGDVTNLQKAFTAAMISTVSPWLRDHVKKVKVYGLKITDAEMRKALMLTHYPFDLLAPSFRNLVLLESHTGALKPKQLWYTKYLDGKELAQIPFTEQFIQVFGDKEHFRPMSPSIKRKILEVAEKYNWHPLQTQDKTNYGLDQMSDKYLRDILRAMR